VTASSGIPGGNMTHLPSADAFLTFDRILATVAIVLGVGGIWRAEHLFKKLNERADGMTEEFLRQAITVVMSYASFTRALQGVELLPAELREDGAFALLTTFHLQKLLHSSKFRPEQLAELRALTRKQLEKSALEDAQLLIKSGLGKLKEGVEFNPELG
jgi:hypothetical protein